MKTLCIYHSRDLDGWMSAAIVKKWFEMVNPGSSFYDLNSGAAAIPPPDEIHGPHSLDFLGWDYGDPIVDVSEYQHVVMVDIALSLKDDPDGVNSTMMELFKRNTIDDKKFIWIDHHFSSIQKYANPYIKHVLHGSMDKLFAACELTWMYFFPGEEMPEIVRLLGRYDCFGHKDTDEEQKVLEFQYGARALMNNYDSCYYYLNHENNPIEMILNLGQGIYRYLCTEAKQTYAKSFMCNFSESVSGVDYKFLLVNQERFNPINFGIDYHKDGYDGFGCFWYNNGKWSFSLYNDNENVDCSAICKQYGGGGHKGAAGFTTNDIGEFLGI